jgi:hypothetical protein
MRGKDAWVNRLPPKQKERHYIEEIGNPRLSPDTMRRFITEYYPTMAGYAAEHISRYCKGALFHFSKFVLAWGSKSKKSNSCFSANFLCRKFPQQKDNGFSTTMDACSNENFARVICCDSSGKSIPDDFADHLRSHKGTNSRRAPFHTPLNARFLDFQAMLL